MLFTDGVVEATSPDGEFFGVGRLMDYLTREVAAGYPAAETLRRLSLAIADHQHGRFHDDATMAMVEWRAPTWTDAAQDRTGR